MRPTLVFILCFEQKYIINIFCRLLLSSTVPPPDIVHFHVFVFVRIRLKRINAHTFIRVRDQPHTPSPRVQTI